VVNPGNCHRIIEFENPDFIKGASFSHVHGVGLPELKNPVPSHHTSMHQSKLAARFPFFYGWTIVYAAGSSYLVRNAAASLTLSVFIVPMSDELGWSRTLIAGAASAAGVASLIVAPLTGWLVDRFGARVLLLSSVLVLGFSTMSLRWATVPIAFYLAYGIGRLIFNSFVNIAGSTVVNQWFVERRGEASSYLGVTHAVGMGGFPLFAQLLINGTGDWKLAWFWMGIAVWVIALVPVWLFLVNRPEDIGMEPDGVRNPNAVKSETATRRTEADLEGWSVKEAMRTPALWLLSFAGGMMFFVHSGTNVHQAAYLRDQGISATGAASAIVVLAVGMAIGSIFWGRLLDRLPGRMVYAIVAVWLGVVTLGYLFVTNIGSAFIVAGLFGFGLAGLIVVPPVVMADYFGRSSMGAVRGFTEPFVGIGQALGAIGAGIIFDTTDSYTAAFPVFTVVAVIAAGILMITKIPTKSTPDAEVVAVDAVSE